MKYVWQLEKNKQAGIMQEVSSVLRAEGLAGDELVEAVENAMNSKVNDLSDLIDINKYI